MKSNIYIPKNIKVGFQNRSGTYTKKLSYIIYYDNKNVLRKEASWNSWRDKSINPIDFENIPTEGFVLNKSVGGYSSGWNHRQSWIRIYDPRDFEFEISLENLLYILEHTNSYKGNGLEGKFVYSWCNKDLILLPVDSPDYKEICKFSELSDKNIKFTPKTLKMGATYLTNKNEKVIYIGKHDEYRGYGLYELIGKNFWFYREDRNMFFTKRTINTYLINVVDENVCANFHEIREKLESNRYFSPVDLTKTEYKNFENYEEFETWVKSNIHYLPTYFDNEKILKLNQTDLIYGFGRSLEDFKATFYKKVSRTYWYRNEYEYYAGSAGHSFTLKEFYDNFSPKYAIYHLRNGSVYINIKDEFKNI